MSAVNFTEDKIYSSVVDILKSEREQKEDVTLESKLTEDLELDSLDQVELVMKFEEQFNISILDDEATQMKSVGDIVNLIKTKLKGENRFLDKNE